MASIRAALQLALQHHRANRLEDAEAIYEGVLRINPENLKALLGRGKILLQRGDLVQSESCLRKALSLEARPAEAWYTLGRVMELKNQWPDAERCYRQVTALNPGVGTAHRQLAYALERQGRHEAAMAGYKKASEVQLATIEVKNRAPFDNIYHCCTQKTASQWFRALFNDEVFYA